MNTPSTLIKPTIGRKVWFWPNSSHIGVPAQAQPESQDPNQAMDATIVFVHGDRCVNLLVVDHTGATWPVRSVTLQQEGDPTIQGMYAQWMPYQTGQAKKIENFSAAIARTMTLGATASIANDATDLAIEQEIQAKGLSAPRVTPDDLQANIVSEQFFTAADGAFAADDGPHSEVADCRNIPDALNYLTLCVLVLRNGFTVTGESACASPENFNAEIGRNIARENAVQKCWPLMGYALKDKLANK